MTDKLYTQSELDSELSALRERCAKVAKTRAVNALKPYAYIFNHLATDILSVPLATNQCGGKLIAHPKIQVIAPEYWCPKCRASSANSRRCGSCDNPVQCLNIEAIIAQRDSFIPITPHTEEGAPPHRNRNDDEKA